MSGREVAASNPLWIRKHFLEDGASLYFQKVPSSSRVSVASWIGEGGSSLDGKGKEGLAMLTAKLLASGTTLRSKREMSRNLDRLGATLTAEASWDNAMVEIRGPQEVEKELFSILFEVVSRPLFAPMEVARVKRLFEERLLRERSVPALRARRAFIESLFPSAHPYRANPLGTIKSLGHVKATDVDRFHREHYSRQNSRVVITSPSEERTILSSVKDLEFSLPEGDGTLSLPSPTPRRSSSARRELSIPIPGSKQVEVLLGGEAPSRETAAYSALRLADEILGGRPILSRLFQVVREQRGLAYYADSEVEMLRRGGFWRVNAGTESRAVERVTGLLLKEVHRLAESPVSEGELELIRESFLGSFPLHTDTPHSAHALAQEVALFDLAEDYFLTWPEELKRITPGELRDMVAANLLGWEKPLVVIAGGAPS